jgi:O-antigen ligase
MPPDLALLIGAGLVYYAFRSARKRGVNSPPGLFWPTLWYLVVASRMIGLWFEAWGLPLPGSNGDATSGSLVDALFFLVLTIVGLVILLRRHFDWGAALRFNPWIFALLAFMALSILWSGYPFVSFKRYIKVLGSVTMALVVLTNGQPLESIFTVLRRCLYVHLPMSLVCIKYFRDIGVEYDYNGTSYAWHGISTSKNDLGQVAMLGVLYFTFDITRHWRQFGWRNFDVLYLLLAVYLLKGSEQQVSMTSVSVCAFALLVFWRLRALRSNLQSARRWVLGVFYVTLCLVTFILIHSVVFFSENSIFGKVITMLGRDITLTGRTDIWHDVYGVASSNPLFGVGYGGFWIGRLANIQWDANLSWVLGQAHNGYIDTYLQIGLIGSALLAGVLFTTMRRLLASMDEDFDFACFRITVFLTVIFVNSTETTYLRGDHHLWFIMLLVVWMVPQTDRVLPKRTRENIDAAERADVEVPEISR